jgi:hypothetical protein
MAQRWSLHIYVLAVLSVKTTIDIGSKLLRQIRRRAAEEEITISQVVESALCVYFSGQTKRKRYQLNLKTERGRMLPGVRLDNRDALFNLMDGWS